MYATHRTTRPFTVGFAWASAGFGALLVLAAAYYYLSPPFLQTPIDEPRSRAAWQYMDTGLTTRWSQIPQARAALNDVEVRGPVLYVLTSAPSTGDVRPQVAPMCFVATDYVESHSDLRSFRILANDGSTFQFNQKQFCLMAGY